MKQHYSVNYFSRVTPLDWRLSHFLHYTEKMRPKELSKQEVEADFIGGLQDVLAKESKKRVKIFKTRAELNTSDITAPRNLAGAKIFIARDLLGKKKTRVGCFENAMGIGTFHMVRGTPYTCRNQIKFSLLVGRVTSISLRTKKPHIHCCMAMLVASAGRSYMWRQFHSPQGVSYACWFPCTHL